MPLFFPHHLCLRVRKYIFYSDSDVKTFSPATGLCVLSFQLTWVSVRTEMPASEVPTVPSVQTLFVVEHVECLAPASKASVNNSVHRFILDHTRLLHICSCYSKRFELSLPTPWHRISHAGAHMHDTRLPSTLALLDLAAGPCFVYTDNWISLIWLLMVWHQPGVFTLEPVQTCTTTHILSPITNVNKAKCFCKCLLST